jgi:hypothetical protein
MKIPEIYMEVDVRALSLTVGDVIWEHLRSKAFFIYQTISMVGLALASFLKKHY